MKKFLSQSLKEHKVNVIFILLLLTVSSTLLCVIPMVLISSEKNSDNYYNGINHEDYRLIYSTPVDQYNDAYKKLSNNISKEYGAKESELSYKTIKKDEKTYEVYNASESREIDKLTVTIGNYPTKDNQVMVTDKFAEVNDYTVGDIFEMDDKSYTISGIVNDPNFVMAIPDSSLVPEYENFGGVYVTKDAYKNLKYQQNEVLLLNNVELSEEQQNDIINNSKLTIPNSEEEIDAYTNIVSFDQNQRVAGYKIQIEKETSMISGLIILTFVISIVLSIILFKQIVREKKKDIGILRAEGYKDGEIQKAFVKGFSLLASPFLLIGLILGMGFSKQINLLNETNMSIIKNTSENYTLFAVILVLALLIIYIIILKGFVIKKVFNESVVDQINNREKAPVTRKVNKDTKNLSTKMMKINIKKGIIIYLMVFFLSIAVITLMALSSASSKMSSDDFFTSDSNLNYMIFTQEKVAGEKGLYLQVKSDSSPIQLYAYDDKSTIFNYELNDDEVVISPSVAHLLNVETGDDFSIDYRGHTLDFNVKGISKDNVGNIIYSNRDYVNNKLDYKDDNYNVTFAKSLPTDMSTDDYYSINLQNSQGTMSTQMQMMKSMISFFIFFIVLIAVMSIIFIVSLLIRDYKNDIAVLQVLGYKKDRIVNMYFTPHIYIMAVLILFSTMFSYNIIANIKYFATADYGIVVPIECSSMQIISGILIMVIVIGLAGLFVIKKLNEIDFKLTLNGE